jgi:hypothetical protein
LISAEREGPEDAITYTKKQSIPLMSSRKAKMALDWRDCFEWVGRENSSLETKEN